MGFESIPLLTAIWTAVASVVKIIWDSISRAASRAAFYFVTIIPMVIRWFVKYRAFALALVLAVAALIRTFLVQVYNVVNQSMQVQNALAYMEANFEWMFWICVHGPLALDVMYRKLLTEILPVVLSLIGLKWSWRKTKFLIWLLNRKFHT